MKRAVLALTLSLMVMDDAISQVPYQKPPQAVLDVLNAEPTPSVSLDPTKTTILLVTSARYPAIAELAEPMLRLAGARINPKTNGPARSQRITKLALMPVEGGQQRNIELPTGKISSPDWSPDGKRFTLLQTLDNGVYFCVGNVETGKLETFNKAKLNAAFGDPVRWMPDSKSLLIQMIPPNRGEPPAAPKAPVGPTIQESAGTSAPVRTFQDLLQNAHDEDLFDYYATSQLVMLNLDEGNDSRLGKPAIFSSISPSPDGKHILVSRIHKPYSYLHTMGSFPRTVEVWHGRGEVAVIADHPLEDKVPIEGVPSGRRSISWLPTADATLTWVKALDGGDPKTKVPHRDQVFLLAAPFTDNPKPLFKIEHRFMGMSHFPDGDRVLVSDFDRDRRWRRTMIRSLNNPDAEPKVLFDRSIQDRYNDPGTPLTKRLPNGRSALWVDNGALYLSGLGATPKGDRPFLDRLDLASGEKKRIFHCAENVYETTQMLDDGRLLVRRESNTEPGNYFLRAGDKDTAITDFKDPVPQIRGIKKQLVTTKRPDGVTISFTLMLPPDYKEGQKYPAVFWAYPREFTTADTAGQISGSTNRFTSINGFSHLFFLLNGYVVMDDVSTPIVGPPETANDTFVEQLTASAKAAIDKAVEMGVVDRDRIGCGGHSYGAFMTANLLAHCDLFRAGIARSGAYNRTLTPFGFQSERRTFWEAPEIYNKLSPFTHAHKINEPLLMIHGAADDNPGTFPVQSERLYQAMRGNGGLARLVMLPHEAHGYSARESIEHVLAEQIQWFDKYVKNAPSRTP